MPTNPERRPLRYASLDDVMPDVDRLLAGGYRRAGNWSLGRICNHLAGAITATVEGLPVRVPRWKRLLFGKLAKRYVFGKEAMPEGVKVPNPSLEPPSEADDRAEAEALRAAIRLFRAEPGPFPDHPLFGPLTGDEWRRFHCIHCAHHLSFVRPSDPLPSP